MFNKKITRKEFLKAGFLGIFVFFAAPVLKIFDMGKKPSGKNAKYYKNLAG